MTDQDTIDANADKFDRLAKFSGMPLETANTHLLMKFLPSKGTEKAMAAVLKFVGVDQAGKPLRQHSFITLAGEPGRGKTHLALGIGWHWIGSHSKPVKYWQAERLLAAARREFDSPRKDDYGQPLPSVLETAERVPLLILDDLGAEKTTEWAEAKLDELIDYRYINRLPTVFTTNLAPAQLTGRIASRLKEGVTVTLEGPDYREVLARARDAGAAEPKVLKDNDKKRGGTL